MLAWNDVPHAQRASQQSTKRLACLEMVLMFHNGEPWTPEKSREWNHLQAVAGREFPRDSATTKVLCDTIREVLGLQEESMATKE